MAGSFVSSAVKHIRSSCLGAPGRFTIKGNEAHYLSISIFTVFFTIFYMGRQIISKKVQFSSNIKLISNQLEQVVYVCTHCPNFFENA